MSKMALNLNDKGLKSIINQYDLYFIDIWGVVHNGISLYEDAVNVLTNLDDLNKKYVLLTNAPRPNFTVRKFLEKMGLDKKKTEKVYTSGEAALQYLKDNLIKKKFFHIGPPRDFDLFRSFEENKIGEISNSEYLLCTGLFDEYDQELKYYKELLKKEVSKKMICTNPDLVVDRGNIREYCAGSIAKVFEEMGGEVEYFGKPYPNVYKLSADIKRYNILCIGDNLNTDIKGANLQNFSSLFISSGIHRQELEKKNSEKIFNEYNVSINYIQSKLKW